MASHRALVLTGVAGLVLGAAGMAGFLIVQDDGPPAEVATTVAATTTTTVPTWISEYETRLGPAALFPLSLDIEGDDLVLVYDMLPLTPRSADAEMINDGGLAAPAAFTLQWAGGEIAAEVVAPSNRAIRFSLPAGFTLDQIDEIRVDRYWVAAPADMPVVLDPTGETWSAIAPGVEARISHVLDQPNNFVVKVEYRGEAVAANIGAVGDEREWARLSGSMIGHPVWTLDYRGDELPDPLILNTVGIAWVEVDGGGPIDLEGVMP